MNLPPKPEGEGGKPQGVRCYVFGPFRLVPSQRLLLSDDARVGLGSRAFDILLMLVQRAGEVLSTQELMAGVWRQAVVDPGTLRVHIAALRKSLGDGSNGARYVQNIPLKGYCFVAPVSLAAPPANDSQEQVRPNAGQANALRHPYITTRLVGRGEAIQGLAAKFPGSRCVTIVGPGGIGKTSVALSVAEVLDRKGQDVVCVELAPLTDPSLVPSAIASALQVGLRAADPVAGLVAYLQSRSIFLVVDNCEHLVAVVAPLVEALLRGAPRLCVLCTSREALRIEGEWVHRLAALTVPPESQVTAVDVQRFGAVQLFVERARATADAFELSDRDAVLVSDICRRLDGIPLAIELAAASVSEMGLHSLALHLSNRLALLRQGRRTALPRHQTLKATLDWSHELLEPAERSVLRRLAVFRNAFTLDAIGKVCPDDPAMPEAVVSLVSKSLLVADAAGDGVEYRLLEMTREYAAAKLQASGELADVQYLHALYVRDLLSTSEQERELLQPADWLARYGCKTDDVRAALSWALAGGADVKLALALAAAAAPLWFAASLMAEYKRFAERALSLLEGNPEYELADEMKVAEAYGHALWHTSGKGPDIAAPFSRALELAQTVGSVPHQLRSLWGLWLVCNSTGDYAGSASLAHRFGEVAAKASVASVELTHERMLALGLHYFGQQAEALRHARRVLEHPATVNHTARNSGFQFDQRVAALTVLARILWLHGQPADALECARQAVDEALRIDHALSLCYALANGAVPVAFWVGDEKLAAEWTQLLLDRANEHSLVFWQTFAAGYRRLVDRATDRGRQPDRRLAAVGDPGVSVLLLETMCTVDPDLMDEWMRKRAEAGMGGWCAPELLRISAEQGLRRGELETHEAQELLERSLALAEVQKALSWKLRTATSLARLHETEGRPGAGYSLLAPVLAVFPDDGRCRDFAHARDLLKSLKR